MSLLEVLVSIFVILGGMLGVAALLPVGRYEMSMCLRADRAGNAGRAGLREAQVRGMLDPTAWYWFAGQPMPPLDMPVAIDPLGWAAGIDPYPLPGKPGPVFPATLPGQVGLSMPRLTLQGAVSGSPMHPLLADRLFTLQDDLVFDFPAEKTLRPRLLVYYADGNTGTNVTGAVTADREGKYSWMMTVVPNDNEYQIDVGGIKKRQYTLSAVVFYGRQLTADGERTCDVDRASVGPLVGGGDVVLVGGNAVEVRAGEWILLRGFRPVAWTDPKTGKPALRPVYAFKWYRVIAADEFNAAAFGGSGGRRVTLAGPDWAEIAMCQVLQAGVFPGTIGVYTETVELER